MGNSCCGTVEQQKPVLATDGELAGKQKFLSTPSICEVSVDNNRSGDSGKWFLCLRAPLTGQGLSFSAYHSRSNTLMVKFLTDADIVREKEAQNISISYNMFFKALSTEVARAGRNGAKVAFSDDRESIVIDCRIMISGATSRRPDNFSVVMQRRPNPPPADLFQFVIEPICTQYYRKRCNEGWNVERVDTSREKIYGEYETNFILRSTRMAQNTDSLREIVPRVAVMRRDREALRAKRDRLLVQVCVTRTLLASDVTQPGRLLAALSDADRALLPAVATPPQGVIGVPSIASPPEAVGNTASGSLSGSTNNAALDALKLPAGIFLSSTLPNMAPASVGAGGAPRVPDGSLRMAAVNCVEMCILLGRRLDDELKRYEADHPVANMSMSTGTAGGLSLSGALAQSLVSPVSPVSPLVISHQKNSATNIGYAADMHALHGPLREGGFDVSRGEFESLSLTNGDAYFVMDLSALPADLQQRFAQLTSEEDRRALFRCWRSFLSVSRFDALNIDVLSADHSLTFALAMALSQHGVVADLCLTTATVHELGSRLEAAQNPTDPYHNRMRGADRVQLMSVFLKVVQGGAVPRLQALPAIEKLCVLVAAAGCRADVHAPTEHTQLPNPTLAALHIDSANERHSLAVTIAVLRQCAGVAKFVTPSFHRMLSDLILSIDPARHCAILASFVQKFKTATDFSRSLEERRLFLSVLLIGADGAIFVREPMLRDQWVRRLDASAAGGGANAGGALRMSLPRFDASDSSCLDPRPPLKINLPSTFRVGTSMLGSASDDITPSWLVLRSEKQNQSAGFAAPPTCMQGITGRAVEVFERVFAPAFSTLKLIAMESLEAHKRNEATTESTRDSTYAVFSRIARARL